MHDSTETSNPSTALQGLTLGFLGFGRMGQAIARGLRERYAAEDLGLVAFDPAPPAAAVQSEIAGLKLVSSAVQLEADCDVIVLAVKPQDMSLAVADFTGSRKYISIAAGLGTDRLRELLFVRGQKPQISRVMPNISALVGQGVSGIFCPDDEFFSVSSDIFSAVGSVVRIKSEQLMHAVTGLSGSGPAYALAMVHALAEGGVQAGLPFDAALELARDTLLGTMQLLKSTGQHPAVLRNQVTSPGGTTIAGLAALEDGGFHGTVMRAVEAATDRSRELGD